MGSALCIQPTMERRYLAGKNPKVLKAKLEFAVCKYYVESMRMKQGVSIVLGDGLKYMGRYM